MDVRLLNVSSAGALVQRMYYAFYGAESDDDAAFEKRVDSVVREIGERGKALM